ncbi:MAG: hypothetical protein CM15mP49_15380 [Actinomycetota bacterium]|nr:MAG: hypothetical protein CM15mP49_15380 [Actinomycetota bacterium]
MPSLTHEKSFGPPLPVLLVPVKSECQLRQGDIPIIRFEETTSERSIWVPICIFKVCACIDLLGAKFPYSFAVWQSDASYRAFVSSQEVEGSFCDAGGINCTQI